MKKIAYCLFLFITNSYVFLAAQTYQEAVPKDKSKLIDSDGKDPSATAIRVTPRIRENYESTFSRSTVDADRSVCGTMPFFEERHEAQRSCAFYGAADEPEVRDSYIPSGGTPFKTVRLYVHAFVDGNGDTTASLADVEAQMYTLNDEFSPHSVSFEALYDVHYDSEYDSISSWGYYLKEAYAVNPSEYHNVFVTDLDGYLGVSTFPWDTDALNIYGGTLVDRYWFGGPRYFEDEYDIPQRTLTHELGHALGLWHTHHGVDEVAECGSCYEGADGYSYSGDDNRDVVGDLCSDTKSTPTNFSCSDPSGTDCQGNNWVDTDVHNYMGYASDLCYNQNGVGFSEQQSGRMHAWVEETLTSQLVPLVPPPDVFISEFAEGSGYNRYIEIYNGTDTELDLSNFAFPGVGNEPETPGEYEYWNRFDSSATIAPGDVYVIANPSADSLILAEADQIFQYITNGDDGFCLVQGGTWTDDDDNGDIDSGEMTGFTILDCIGDWNGDPGDGWDVAGITAATRDHTLVRKSSVVTGNPDWSSSAGTDADNSEWFVLDQDNWDGLGFHPSDPIQEPNFSLSFNGQNNWVSFGQSVIPGSGDVTVQAWSYSEVNDAYREILSQGNSGNCCAYFLGPQSDGLMRVMHSWQGIDVYYPFGEWVNTTVVKNDNGTKLYMNGELVAETGSTELPSDNPFYIGVQYNGETEHWNGHVDEVRVWNIARDQESIQSDLYSKLDGDESGLLAYWNFNEGSGEVLYDLTGNGYNGTIHGATWSEDFPIPPVLGCTDPYSGDYNPDATADDGSCSGYPNNGNYSLSFDGEDDYVDLGTGFNLQDYTIEVRLKTNDTGEGAIISKLVGADQDASSWRIWQVNGVIKSGVDGNSPLVEGNNIADDDWHTVTAQNIGEESMYLHVDGLFLGGASGYYNSTSTQVNIGAQMNGPYFFNQMIIDEIRISNISRYGESNFDDGQWQTDDNTIALYKFNAGEGDILYDHSGNQNHGAINGATWSEDVYVFPVFGCMDPYADNYNSDATVDNGDCSGYPENGNNSLFFNNNSVSIDHNIGDYSSKVTIMAWIKKDGTDGYSNIVSGSCGGLFFTENENKLLFGSQCSNPIAHDTYSSTMITDNIWHHVAATYDADAGTNNLKVYVDGILENESTKNASFNIGDLKIGSSPAGDGEYFNGNIDMLRIWDIALSDEQIQENMYNQFPNEDANLLADWRFNGGEGDILFDHSGNSNHGQINGATWSNDVPQEPYYGPEWYVSTEGSDENNGSYDYPFASVQRAIDAANDYDLVEIFSGEYFENIVINKNLNIGGNNENGDVIINGNQTGSVITIQNISDSMSVGLYGLRIFNGRSDKGGGIFANNTWLEMDQCRVLNNQTAGQGSQGAGIYSLNSSVVMYQCDVENNNANDLPGLGAGVYAENSLVYLYDNSWVYYNNSSSGSGGGIYGAGPGTYLEIHNSNVNNNSSNQNGGGLYLTDSSHVYFIDSNIKNNTAVAQGGGVYLENNSELTAHENTVISGNSTSQDCFTGQGSQGAGLYVSQSTVEYNGGYIWGNESADAGGGLFVTDGSSVFLSFVGMDTNESAEVGGGENTIGGALGIVYDSEVNFDHCTALLNSSTSGGVGGLYAENSNINISSSIFWDNPGEWNSESGQLIGSGFNVAYSDIQGGYPGEGNIDADPLFCDTYYYELAENSPAVGTAQDGGDMGYAGVDCEPIYSVNIESVEIFVEGQSAEFNISADSDYNHFHWIIDYGETFMSNQTTTINDLSVGLHRFAAYLVNSDHEPVSIQFVQNFMIQDTIDTYFSENFDDLDDLDGWGFYTNDYGWEINNESMQYSPTGWRVSQGSGEFAFAQDRNNSDASEDYLVMPEMNLSAFGQPVALEFFSFFTGSRVYSDSLPYGKTSSNVPYNQENYPNMSEYGGDTVEDPLFIDAIPATLTGTTEGYTDDYNEVCPWDESGAPDVVYAFTPEQDIMVDVSMCSDGNQYDTKIYVYENYVGNLANTVHGTSACNDDFCQNSHTDWASFIDGVVLNAGNTYYFIIDGYGPSSYGDYELVLLEDEGFVEHTAHVEISLDGGDNWEEIYLLSPSDQNIWEPVYVDLSNYANESGVLIAFHSNDHEEIGTGWAVDDVTLLTAYQESEGFIVGSVYSEETGEPLSDVYIEAVSEDSSVYNWAISDSSGYFDMGVTGNKYYFFRASNEYGEYVDYFYVGGNETYDLGEIYIGNNTIAFVEGWTSDWYTGQPLGGSNVLFVYDYDGETHTIEQSTAPDGYFMVQVPADHDYDLFIYADGYWAEHDAFYLSAGDHHTLGIGIAPLNMAARVYGSVTDAYSGDMINGAEAVFQCGDSEDWDHTGALGSYRVFSYYPGNCDNGTLSVRADGYRTQYFSAGEMNLQAGQSFTLNVTLEEGNDPEPAVMLGRVHSNNNGEGLGYAQVSAYSYNTGNTYGAEADDSGWYVLGGLIGDQEYEVMASADGYTSVMETHYLGSGDSLYLDFYLDEVPQSGIYGIVENSDGEPLSGVNIYPELNGDEYFWAGTDDSGYYSVNLSPGFYFVSTGINNYYVSSVSGIEVVEQEMVEVNFTLNPVESFDGGAAGIVYSGVGETASGVAVNFWNTALYDAIVYSDENGAYSIELVNGTYNVSVWGEGFESVFIPGVTINNNILPLDIYLFDNGSPQPPVIVQLEDIPNDQGGQMDMVWSPGIPQDWEIFPYYSIWRENEDNWHFISMVPYHDFNVYNMVVPTLGDSTHEGIYWSTFMVTAHTEDPYVFFDSGPSSGYSIDNLPPDTPVGLSAEIIEGGVMLNWSAPLDEDFAYHNVYRNNLMDEQTAMVFTTVDSFYVDSEVDPFTNYEYWVTAVDHSGNESDGSNTVQISPTGLSTGADLVPDVYALGQNYPNPFNPSTQVRYALPEQSQVVLTVYDMLGRKVRTLVNGVQDAGYRSVMWNATSDQGTPVSAGMYIYTIRANEFYQVKKMILLK